jgi:exodeoxyribonuclease VII, small subunit
MSDKSFEESLAELEKIATEIEKGDLGLEQAISEFEKGIKLSKECSEKLDDAEKRINILVKNENGEMTEEEFEQEQ